MMHYEVSQFIKQNNALSGATLTIKEVTHLNMIVTTFKAAGNWTPTGICYPFVTSSAITQSLNLCDPTSYRLTFNMDSSGYHTATGWKNTIGYATTSFAPSTFGRVVTWGIYTRNTSNTMLPVVDNGSGTTAIYTYYSGNGRIYFYNFTSSENIGPASNTANSQGFNSFNANGAAKSIYHNGVSLGTATTATAAGMGGGTTNLGGNSMGNPNHEYTLIFALPFAADTKQAAIYQGVQNAQTILGRNV